MIFGDEVAPPLVISGVFSYWRNANLAERFACRRCFSFFFLGVGFALNCGTKFHNALIVGVEPQSEIGRNREKNHHFGISTSGTNDSQSSRD